MCLLAKQLCKITQVVGLTAKGIKHLNGFNNLFDTVTDMQVKLKSNHY